MGAPEAQASTAASYDVDQPLTDGRIGHAARVIPTFSVDTGAIFERDSTLVRQGPAPDPGASRRSTPTRRFAAQLALPNFDSAPIDFNTVSVYTENAFSGIDRVSDGHQITAGATTGWLDHGHRRRDVAPGYRATLPFRDQLVTPDGVPRTQRLSDLLLDGSTSLVPNWQFDLQTQYSAESSRPVRSIVGVRYLPEPFHALSATYRFARGLSEQVELGWQWPVYRGNRTASSGSGGCGGTLYAVGRVNYSTRDARFTDSIAGFEYDAGCWIGRIVAERLSVGRTEATTRLLLQLELVGLSRIGSNPLQVLKDNILATGCCARTAKGPTNRRSMI